jgi:hypothetical protein
MFTEIPLIDLRAYKTILTGIDNDTIAEQIMSAGRPVDPNDTAWEQSGGRHTYYEDVLPPRTPEIDTLEHAIEAAVTDTFDRKYRITELWSIRTRPNQSIVPHNHRMNIHMNPLEYYSFAYYPLAPEGSADLTFHVGYCHTIETCISVPVEPGALIVFNSFVWHFTERQTSTEDRMNLSGNLAPVDPDQSPTANWEPYWRR